MIRERILKEIMKRWKATKHVIKLDDFKSSINELPSQIKGAIIGGALVIPLTSVVMLQCNPDTMTRNVKPKAAGREVDCSVSFTETNTTKGWNA